MSDEIPNRRRVVFAGQGGGAAVAARAIATARGDALLELGKEKGWRRVFVFISLVFNYAFRKKGEDWLWPAFFCSSGLIPASGDELHWVLSSRINLTRLHESAGVRIYMHDEWWCSGWEAYECLEDQFEYAPAVLPRFRERLRSYFRKKAFKVVERTRGCVTYISPSKYLMNRCSKRGITETTHDALQAKVMSIDPTRDQSLAKKDQIIFYAPLGSSYRKGSDRTLAVAQMWRNGNVGVCNGLVVGGYPVKDGAEDRHLRSLGFLTRDELFVILQESKLIVFLTRRDNLPNIVGEAISSGTRVLTTESSGASEFPSNLVEVVQEVQPEAVVLRINQIMHHKVMR